MAGNQRRVVAELGRPETPEEEAARKAESSRLHRVRQTPNNLVYSLLVTVLAVVVLVLLVPRSEAPTQNAVDYHSLAAQAQPGMPTMLADPDLPAGWHANVAEYRSGASDGVDVWFIGFITPSDEFIGLSQAFDANDTWVAEQLHNTIATGSVEISGIPWTVYDNRKSSSDVGNAKYALVTQTPKSTWVLAGTASPAEFRTLAKAIAPTVAAEAD
ncbi:DUF4245 domain-containing protein [Rathayibacter sp. YIM 133350]|uniref:DUF4245 domain-containing protein n=1 Tax=Rathayibacter sp. YIM 133350 TaxID=3131992 RepID=UPI00307EA9FB